MRKHGQHLPQSGEGPGPGTRPAGPGSRRGFSLVELAVVMVIVSMVLAAALPNFIRRRSWDAVQGAAREMTARVSYVRQLCVASRTPYRLNLDRPNHAYNFEKQAPNGTWSRSPDKIFQVSGAAGMTSTANGDGSITTIYFNTDGTIQSQDVPLQVHYISARGDTGTMVLVCTGRATVRTSRVN